MFLGARLAWIISMLSTARISEVDEHTAPVMSSIMMLGRLQG
jgi:hypothetical protein